MSSISAVVVSVNVSLLVSLRVIPLAASENFLNTCLCEYEILVYTHSVISILVF